MIQFPANTLPLAEQLFVVVQVTSSLTNLSSTTTITINTVAAVVARLQLTVVGISATGYVNGFQPVRILGTVTRVASANNSAPLTLAWDCENSTSTQSIGLTAANLLSPTNTFNLVFAPGILLAGLPYLFRLNATNSAGTGSSSILVSIYPSPTGGLLSVDSSSGFAFQTLFTFSALFWT